MRRALAVSGAAAAMVAFAHCGGNSSVALGGDDGALDGSTEDAQSDATPLRPDASVDASTDGANPDATTLDSGSDGSNDASGCVDPVTDCPATGSECAAPICTTNGACGQTNVAVGAACANDAGGVVCNGAGACVATHCMDGVQDGNETGSDCGGPTCQPCTVGGGCTTGPDCTTGYCSPGMTCALAPNGAACTVGSSCASGDCIGTGHGTMRVCCASACSDMGPASCGESGACSANGATCELYPAGTDCGMASCSGSTGVVTESVCDGAGACVAGSAMSCAPYVCVDAACLTACGTSNARCASNAYCDGVGDGTCRPKLPTGSACIGSGASCVTGECVDGFCCNSQCGATCMACAATLTGSANGACANVMPGTADGACQSCDGAAACTPNCGDALLETGEQCDLGPNDGVAGSGCSATCQLTGDFIPETEPNDTQATANQLGTHAGFIAAIEPEGDIDYFSFTVPGPSSSVTIQTGDGVGGCPAGFDSIVRLYDPAGVQIATDDNGGVSPCSLISPMTQPQVSGLAAGTYRARVDFSGDDGTTPQYVVTIAVQ
jgi:hypothetical protein